MKKCKITITFVALAFLGFGVFAFLKYGSRLQVTNLQSQIAISGLKTYKNVEQGFEFRYPSDWSLYENAFYNMYSRFNLIGAAPNEGDKPNPINPSILVNIVNKNFAAKAVTKREGLGATISNISIAGLQAIKYEYIDQVPKISVDIAQNNYHFIISSPKKYEDVLNQILISFRFIDKYEINSQGELIKQLPSREQIDLVVLGEMEGGFVVDNWSGNKYKVYPFIKGRVLDYWPSPDGKYIAYSVQEGLVSCCMAPPSGASNRLKLMKSDGSEKRLIDKTPRGGAPYVSFDGWLPDSKGFVFHDWFPDESTGGSPFFRANVDGSQNQFFDSIDYGDQEVTDNTYQVTVALAEPYFSPKDNLMVYRKGGIDGNSIILSNTDGTNRKMLLDGIKGMSYTKWSQDGRFIDVIVGDKETGVLHRFNKKGERIKK